MTANHLDHHADAESQHGHEEDQAETEGHRLGNALGRDAQRGKVLNGDFRDRDLIAGLAWRFDLSADEESH